MLSALLQQLTLLLLCLHLFLVHELQVLLLKVSRQVFQHPPVLHQLQRLDPTLRVPQ